MEIEIEAEEESLEEGEYGYWYDDTIDPSEDIIGKSIRLSKRIETPIDKWSIGYKRAVTAAAYRETVEYEEKRKKSYIKRKLREDRRRNLGYKPLNKLFDNSESHHIDENYVIHIPKELHRRIRHNLKTGKNMDKINALAFKFLFSQ